MDSKVDALFGSLAALDIALKETKEELSTQTSVSSHARRRTNLSLTGHAARVVWIMYSLSVDPSGAVLHFLRGAGRGRRFADVTDESLLAIAENSFSLSLT